MKKNNFLVKIVLFSFLFIAIPLFAEEFPQDDLDGVSIEKAFSEEKGITDQQKQETLRDRMEIGGSLFSDFYYSTYSTKKFSDFLFYNTNLAYVYLDSKLEKDVRFFAKGKFTYTPTLNENDINPYTGQTSKQLVSELDELKLMFNAKNLVFFTIGKQKIKYGSGKFWNPTDFLNTTMKDPFYTYDRRVGVALVKAHVPLGNSNFYLIGDVNEAKNLDQIGYVLRYEVPINSSEFALTMRAKKDRSTKLGLDLSTALYEFDVYGEMSVSKGSDKVFYDQLGNTYTDNKKTYIGVTGGISYEWQYIENDTMTFNLEYYYNKEGYNSPSIYPILWANNAYVPLNTGRQYAMFMVYVPKPGSWNSINISMFNIANLIDSSLITRTELMYLMTHDLSIGFNATVHYGKANGEFRTGGQLVDLGVRFEVNF